MKLRRTLQDHPRPLEWAYRITERLFLLLSPVFTRVGYSRVERVLLPFEQLSKELLFDCRMCGQCILRLTGMTCPMTCPKLLRNGPCGGVRPGGYCEVYPERRCVWTDAYERSGKMPTYGDSILDLQPPVNWQLQSTSAWLNVLTGADAEELAQRNPPP
jgi:hypothetical protein